MSGLPSNPLPSLMKRNPHLWPPACREDVPIPTASPKRIRQSGKALLNKTEGKWKAILDMRGITGILEQAITLRLDPPFKSYRPDMAYIRDGQLTLVEVKGPHRFREKGIARAALAAKTYPMFRFELADWTANGWKESVFTP